MPDLNEMSIGMKWYFVFHLTTNYSYEKALDWIGTSYYDKVPAFCGIGDDNLIILPLVTASDNTAYPLSLPLAYASTISGYSLLSRFFYVMWHFFYRSINNLNILICTWTIWQINNAGTSKGFRPLLQFSDEDIKQVFIYELVNDFFNRFWYYLSKMVFEKFHFLQYIYVAVSLSEQDIISATYKLFERNRSYGIEWPLCLNDYY